MRASSNIVLCRVRPHLSPCLRLPRYGTTLQGSSHDLNPGGVLRLGERVLVRSAQHAQQKGVRYWNPATAVISSLLINIVVLWGMTILLVPISNVTAASLLIFVVVGFFQPGLTRLLTHKGIDTLGVAITDPVRATTPLFSAMMAIIFLGEEISVPIVVATFMIVAGVTLLSWRRNSMNLVGSALYLWYPIAASALAGASQVVRKFGLAAVPHPFLAAAVTATSSLVVSVLTMWYVEKTRQTRKMNRDCFW